MTCSNVVIPNTASLKSDMYAVLLPCNLVLILRNTAEAINSTH